MDQLESTLQNLITPVTEKVVAGFTLKFAAVVVIDEAHKIVYASDVADRLFSYPLGGLRGRLIHDVVPESVREDHQRYVSMFFAGAMSPGHAMGAGIPRKIMGQPLNGNPFPIVVTLNRFADDLRNYAHALIQRVAEDVKGV